VCLIAAGKGMHLNVVSRGAMETIVKNIDKLASFLTGKSDYFSL
jgi:hypothetical protein